MCRELHQPYLNIRVTDYLILALLNQSKRTDPIFRDASCHKRNNIMFLKLLPPCSWRENSKRNTVDGCVGVNRQLKLNNNPPSYKLEFQFQFVVMNKGLWHRFQLRQILHKQTHFYTSKMLTTETERYFFKLETRIPILVRGRECCNQRSLASISTKKSLG